MKNNLILIGFMGCGKSTLGTKLSYRLKRSLLDTDALIEKEAKMTISDIFAKKGEAGFRQIERECLEKLIREDTHDKIISTGGGLPVQPGNGELLKQLGTVVWLRLTPDTVYERLKGNTTRPLLQTENPYERICSMLEQRDPLYEAAADLIVDVDDKTIYESVAQIEALWRKENG